MDEPNVPSLRPHLICRDAARAIAVVFPVADPFYGERSGRFADPFGHLGLVTQRIRQMTDEEIQAAVDRYPGG